MTLLLSVEAAPTLPPVALCLMTGEANDLKTNTELNCINISVKTLKEAFHDVLHVFVCERVSV